MPWSSLNFVCWTLVFFSLSHGKITLHEIFNWEDDECFETKGPIYKGLTCPELLDEALGYCYTAIYDQCCLSCNFRRLRYSDCKFGDSSMDCRAHQCGQYDAETREICCETCRDYDPTMKPTTTPTPTTTVAVLNKTRTVVSSHRKEKKVTQNKRRSRKKSKSAARKTKTSSKSKKIIKSKVSPVKESVKTKQQVSNQGSESIRKNVSPVKDAVKTKHVSKQVSKSMHKKKTEFPRKSSQGKPKTTLKTPLASPKSVVPVYGFLNSLSGPGVMRPIPKNKVKVKVPSEEVPKIKTKPPAVKKKKIIKTKKLQQKPTGSSTVQLHKKPKKPIVKKTMKMNDLKPLKPVHMDGKKDYTFNYVKDASIKPQSDYPVNNMPDIAKKQVKEIGKSVSNTVSKIRQNEIPSTPEQNVLTKHSKNPVPITDKVPVVSQIPKSTISEPMDAIQNGQLYPISSALTSDWTDPFLGPHNEEPWIEPSVYEKTMTLSAPQMSIPEQLKNTVISMPNVEQAPNELLEATVKQSKSRSGPSDIVGTKSGSHVSSSTITGNVNGISKISSTPIRVETKVKKIIDKPTKKTKPFLDPSSPLPDPIANIVKTEVNKPKQVENIWDSSFPLPDPLAGVNIPTPLKQTTTDSRFEAPKGNILPREMIIKIQAGHHYDEKLFKHAIQKAAIQAVLEHAGSSILSRHTDPTLIVENEKKVSVSKQKNALPVVEKAVLPILSKQDSKVPAEIMKSIHKKNKNDVEKLVKSVVKEAASSNSGLKKLGHVDKNIVIDEATKPISKKIIFKKPVLPVQSVLEEVSKPKLPLTPLINAVAPKKQKVKHFPTRAKDIVSQVEEAIKSHANVGVKQKDKKIIHAPEVKKLLNTLTGTQNKGKLEVKKVTHAPEVKKLLNTLTGSQNKGKSKTIIRKIERTFDPHALPPSIESAIVGDLPQISLKESVLNVPEEVLQISKQQRNMVNVPLNILGETHIPLSMDLSKFSVPKKSPEIKSEPVLKVQKPEKINKVIKPDIKSAENIKVLPKPENPPRQIVENIKTIEHTFHIKRVPKVRKRPTVQGRGPVTTMQRANANAQQAQPIARPVTFLPPSFMTPIIQNLGIQQANALFQQPVLVKRTHEFKVIRTPTSRSQIPQTVQQRTQSRQIIPNTGLVARHQTIQSFNSIHPPIRQNHNIQNSFRRNTNPSPFVRTVRRQNIQFSRQLNNQGRNNRNSHVPNRSSGRRQNPTSMRLNNLANAFTHVRRPTTSFVELPPVVVHHRGVQRTTFMQQPSIKQHMAWPYNFYRM